MSGRIAAMSMDGTPVSEADVARIEAEEQMHAQWRRATVRVVAAASQDATDCRMLISILGLDDDVAAARAEKPARKSPRRQPRRRGTHAAA